MKKYFGLLSAMTSVVLWASMFPVGRALIGGNMVDPVTLGMFRFLIAGPLLVGAGVIFFGFRKMFALTGRDILSVAVLGLIGTTMMAALLFYAQRTLPSINASMLEAIVPLQIFVISVVFGRRKIIPLQIAGLLLGFCGCMLVLRVIDGNGLHLNSLSLGDLCIFLSGLCWSVYTVWGRPVANRLGGYIFSAWSILAGGLIFAIWQLFRLDAVVWPSTGQAWGMIFYFALFPTALSFLCWNHAQKMIPLSVLSFTEYFTPMLAALFGFLFIHETINFWQLAGAVIVIGASLIDPEFLSLRSRGKETEKEPQKEV